MKRTPKRDLKRTPPRRSLRRISSVIKQNPVKRLKKMRAYESPLKHFHNSGKRHLLDEDLNLSQITKRQKFSRKRESVIIINDENDLDCSRPMKKKAQNSKNNSQQEKSTKPLIRVKKPSELTNDSVIILEDDENQPSAENLNQTDDVMVVWSSVPDSPKQTNEIQNPNSSVSDPFVVDITPSISNLHMLKGDYPQKWLGDWLSEEKNVPKSKPKRKIKSPSKSITNQADKKKTKTPTKNLQGKQQPKKKKANTEKNEPTEVSVEKEKQTEVPSGKLREIIIDGLNVGKTYSNGRFFSEDGLKLVIDFFKKKGHPVKVFLPQHVRNRKRKTLETLHRDGFIVFTPSRKAGTKSITPYEDRFILEYATKCNGIVVSNDQFKDLYEEKPEWRETIEKRILPATFVGDHLMFPEDPLGRHGPKLDKFLRHET